MLELKVGKTYRDGFGEKVKIIIKDDMHMYPFVGDNHYHYSFNGAFLVGVPVSYDLIEEVVDAPENALEFQSTIESSDHSLSHSDIQLQRKVLITHLNTLEFLILENEDWSKRLYRQATPESADGIAAFHELNKCKDSIRYCKKERKHVAELLRKLKKQQADILRNNAKV